MYRVHVEFFSAFCLSKNCSFFVKSHFDLKRFKNFVTLRVHCVGKRSCIMYYLVLMRSKLKSLSIYIRRNWSFYIFILLKNSQLLLLSAHLSLICYCFLIDKVHQNVYHILTIKIYNYEYLLLCIICINSHLSVDSCYQRIIKSNLYIKETSAGYLWRIFFLPKIGS